MLFWFFAISSFDTVIPVFLLHHLESKYRIASFFLHSNQCWNCKKLRTFLRLTAVVLTSVPNSNIRNSVLMVHSLKNYPRAKQCVSVLMFMEAVTWQWQNLKKHEGIKTCKSVWHVKHTITTTPNSFNNRSLVTLPWTHMHTPMASHVCKQDGKQEQYSHPNAISPLLNQWQSPTAPKHTYMQTKQRIFQWSQFNDIHPFTLF